MSQQKRKSQLNGSQQILVAAVAATLGLSGLAMGQVSWVGPAGVPSPWETPANWSSGNVPNGDVTFIDNGGIATVSTYTGSVLALSLGSVAGASGSIVQGGGSLSTDGGLVLGNGTFGAAGSGTYTMNSGFLGGPDFFIGSKGFGTLNMNGGSIVSAGHMRLGDDEGSNGVMNMTGGTVLLPGFLLVGHFSPAGSPRFTTGTLNMSGGTLTVANFNMGQHPQARGEVHQTGGWIQNTANTVLGEISRQENKYFLSGGTLRVAGGPGGGTIFAGSSAGIGQFNVSGTGNAQIDGHIFAGSGTTSFGTFTMSGGTVTLGLNKPGGGFMVAGEFGNATVNFSGGVFTADFMQFGRRFNATSQGQFLQTGGTATVRRAITVGGLSGNNNFYEISGGAMNITDDTSNAGTNELQSGIHVARFSVNPGTFTTVTGYSNGRLTINGTAAVNITSALYNSTGFAGVLNDGVGTQTVQLPGGRGLIEMKGGTLNAGSFVNGGAANASTFNNGGASAAYVQTGGNASVGHVTGTGTVAVSGGTMTVSSIAQSGLTVSGGLLRVTPNGTDTATSRVGSMTLSGTGVFDLSDNNLVVGVSNYAAVAAKIASARNGGAWNGPGLSSSSAAAATPKNTTLGTLTGAEYLAVNGATFDGVAVNASDVLVKYTYYGDTDFNGQVNFDDYSRIDAGFNQGRTGWLNGDFDYNGSVNFDDYSLIDLAFNTQSGTLIRAMSYLDGGDRSSNGMNAPALQRVMEHLNEFGEGYANSFLNAVPEPGSALVFTGLAALAAIRRRRVR